MIKAICDKCGKEVVLRYFEQGFEKPLGWDIESLYLPAERRYAYQIFCIDCNPRIVRIMEEGK